MWFGDQSWAIKLYVLMYMYINACHALDFNDHQSATYIRLAHYQIWYLVIQNILSLQEKVD